LIYHSEAIGKSVQTGMGDRQTKHGQGHWKDEGWGRTAVSNGMVGELLECNKLCYPLTILLWV
jgi:hypothetical protein